MLLRRLPLLLLLVSALSLTACDSDTDDDGSPVELGSFVLDAVGDDFETSFSGDALFGQETDPESGETVFVIMLTSEGEAGANQSRLMLATDGSRPGEGSYEVLNLGENPDTDEIPANEWVGWLNVDVGETPMQFLSSSGTVEIDDSGSDVVSGSFDFQATGFVIVGDQGQSEEVHVYGTFEAVDAEGSLGVGVLFP